MGDGEGAPRPVFPVQNQQQGHDSWGQARRSQEQAGGGGGKGGSGQRVALVGPGAPRPLPASSSSFLRPQAGAQCPPWPCPCASPSLRMANSVSTALPTPPPPLISLCFFLRTGVQGQALSCCHPVGSGGPEGHQLSIQPRGPRPRGSKHTHTQNTSKTPLVPSPRTVRFLRLVL